MRTPQMGYLKLHTIFNAKCVNIIQYAEYYKHCDAEFRSYCVKIPEHVNSNIFHKFMSARFDAKVLDMNQSIAKYTNRRHAFYIIQFINSHSR